MVPVVSIKPRYNDSMKNILPATTLLFFLPLIAQARSFQDLLTNTLAFLNNTVIPFLIGIAFLFFVFNAIRFFVFNGTNQEGREKAKALALYGILAFVLIITFWGIVRMFSSSIGLDECDPIESDYVKKDFNGPPDTCLSF